MKQEFSAGGAVYRKITNQDSSVTIEWLIGKHSGYHKWVLPKGLIESGESKQETALREVFEETGVSARIVGDNPIHTEVYEYQADFSENAISVGGVERRVMTYQESGGGQSWVRKTVDFYLMEYVEGDIADHSWEMEDVRWLSYESALDTLAFAGEKSALEKASAALSKHEEGKHEKN